MLLKPFPTVPPPALDIIVLGVSIIKSSTLGNTFVFYLMGNEGSGHATQLAVGQLTSPFISRDARPLLTK